MADGTSGPESVPGIERTTQRFGTIVVVGGGCYGSYYVRQLLRAERAAALAWESLVVVDRVPACRVASLALDERPHALRIEQDDWRAWFDRYLTSAATAPARHEQDAIVPSPLMPHLMADWLLGRARVRWPQRHVGTEPLASAPAVPWQRAAGDGTHYVSFAEWICPINCVEPARCPHTKGERSWSLPTAIADYVADERAAGRPMEGPYVFHCTHRAYGVGMLDVRNVLAADRAIAELGADRAVSVLVGTASHCHGALQRIVVEA
jgi:hypothetical protein